MRDTVLALVMLCCGCSGDASGEPVDRDGGTSERTGSLWECRCVVTRVVNATGMLYTDVVDEQICTDRVAGPDDDGCQDCIDLGTGCEL